MSSTPIPDSVDENGNPVIRYYNQFDDDILVFSAKKGEYRFFLKYSPVVREEMDHIYAQIGEDPSPTSPVITVTSHSNGDIINRKKININGNIRPFNQLATLLVGGVEASISTTGLFSADISLEPGQNNIQIKAIDKTGYPTAISLNLFYKTPSMSIPTDIAPVITITSPSNNAIVYSQFAKINVTLDNQNIRYIDIINAAGTIQKTGHIGGIFSANVELVEGSNLITIIAESPNGTKSESYITIIRSGTTAEVDPDGPVITITSKHHDGYVADISPIELQGTVDDPEVTSISINAVDVDVINGYWEHTVALEEGENIIEIEAQDHSENVTTLALTIIYSPRQ